MAFLMRMGMQRYYKGEDPRMGGRSDAPKGPLDVLKNQMELGGAFFKFAKLSRDDLQGALDCAGLTLPKEEVDSLIEESFERMGEQKTEFNLLDFIALVDLNTKREELLLEKKQYVLKQYGLEEYDKNKDGKITRDEVEKVIKELHKSRYKFEISDEAVASDIRRYMKFDSEGCVKLDKFRDYVEQF